MEELTLIITRAQKGDVEAYDVLVYRFQDMAIAYAFSALGDMEAAEDAAQEAFIEAFYCICGLREPWAFSSWLRRIIWKQCDRILRRNQLDQVPLDMAQNETLENEQTHLIVEKKEISWEVRCAIASLPESERVVTLLFYMGQHSQKQVAEFLELPLSTIKKRLYTARQKLRKKMSGTMQEELRSHLPARDPQFADRIKSFTSQFSQMIDEGKSIVYSLSVLAQKQGNTDLEIGLTQIQQDVQEGDTLSEAMSKHPHLFGQAYVATIRQGEINGNLQLLLHQLGTPC